MLKKTLRVLAASAVATASIAAGSLTALADEPVAADQAAEAAVEPAPEPAPAPGNMVVFGDSFTADGAVSIPGTTDTIVPGQTNLKPTCSNSANNWAKQAGAKLGLPVADWSCNGMSVDSHAYVREAAFRGDLNAQTKEVVFMYGGLDPLFFVDTAQQTVINTVVAPVYAEEVKDLINVVREAAPNARISLASYPHMTDNDEVCVLPGGTPGFPGVVVPGVSNAEASAAQAVKFAANYNGVNYIGVHEATAGKSSCAGAERWTAFIPALNGQSNMPAHPTHLGHAGMAEIIANALA